MMRLLGFNSVLIAGNVGGGSGTDVKIVGGGGNDNPVSATYLAEVCLEDVWI